MSESLAAEGFEAIYIVTSCYEDRRCFSFFLVNVVIFHGLCRVMQC